MEQGGGTPRAIPLIIGIVLLAGPALAGCITPEQAATLAENAVGCTEARGAQNDPGRFQYGGAVTCKTGTESYDWANPSPVAYVQWGSGIAKGELEIRILDGIGREVYTGSNDGTSASGQQEQTDYGFPGADPAGSWTIELTFRNVTGSLGLQVFSETPPV